MAEFEEGDVIPFDEAPENEMNHTGGLELVDDNKLELLTDDTYVTLEFSHLRVTDVTPVDEVEP